MVPAGSHRISRVPRYSGAVSSSLQISDTGLSPATAVISITFSYLQSVSLLTVLQPRTVHCYTCGLGSCAFARHYSHNHFCFLFLRVLRCFSSPGWPSGLTGMSVSLLTGCPIGISTDQWIFAPTRSFSQLITSFFASESQGILHVPFSPFLISLSFITYCFCPCELLPYARFCCFGFGFLVYFICIPSCQCPLFSLPSLFKERCQTKSGE